jgi:hypothetical protein
MSRRVSILCGGGLLVIASVLLSGGSNVSADYISNYIEIVDPDVLVALAGEGEAVYIVRFSQDINLSAAQFMDWQSRGDYVYQTLKEEARRSQAGAIAYLQTRQITYRSFITGNDLYVFNGDWEALTFLVGLPDVMHVYLSHTYNLASTKVEVNQGIQSFSPLQLLAFGAQVTVSRNSPNDMSWAVTDTLADQFWITFGLQGEGVLVASIDTGVQWDHPALINSYKCQANPNDPACWYDPTGTCPSGPCDNNGHGTATMGPIVGDDDPAILYQVGLAPGAQWIACKGCSSSACSDVDLIACADWILAPGGDPANRPHLVSNSWGGGGCSDWFDPQINAWTAAGIIATFAPGGSGPGCGTLGSPADHQQVFATTSHDQSRNISSFASRGPSCLGHDPFTKPNMSGPGLNLIVPVPTNGWQTYSGTSFSNGYGAGALVLLLSCAPQLIGDPYAAFDALQDGADPPPPPDSCGAPPDGQGNYTYGYGFINVLEAGLISCDQTASGWLDGTITDQGDGSPLVGAVVTATLSSNPLVWATAIADITGYYTLTLDVGAYDVEAVNPEYAPGFASVEIITETTVTQDFALVWVGSGFGVLEGTITSQNNGVPLGGAVITATFVSDPLVWATAIADGTGYYTMTLETGSYNVLAHYPDYYPGNETVEVITDSVITQDFALIWEGPWFITLPFVVKN